MDVDGSNTTLYFRGNHILESVVSEVLSLVSQHNQDTLDTTTIDKFLCAGYIDNIDCPRQEYL